MKTIVVTVDKAGHLNQCAAFCDEAGWVPDEIVRIPSAARLSGPFERLRLGARGAAAIARAVPLRRGPERVRMFATGRAAEHVAAAYRSLYGQDLFALFSGRPVSTTRVFDVALTGRHSFHPDEHPESARFAGADRVVLRNGVLARRMPCGQGGGLAALIGGVNKGFDVDPTRIASQLAAMARPGEALGLAFSRRTPAATEAALRTALENVATRFVDRDDREGFEALAADADAFVVTPDSLTMICEVCATGKPVRIFDLEALDASSSTHRFAVDFLARGLVGLAPQGAATPCDPAVFAVPRAAFEVYNAWEREGSDARAKGLMRAG